ncbi:acyl-CoA dehydrogenase [Noviherbaspirillum sp. ST9]|uniref:acyl-CoA dehydrogenase n=1 Tax=Noviherbaspirillum sp. ST9 TaxID=3401606 RepID=UPI003B58AED5
MRPTVDFLLFDWLRVEALTRRDRFAEHGRETFVSVLDMCERVAREEFAPHNRISDVEEPYLEDGRVVLPAAALSTSRAYLATGMMTATQDADAGGMQLPFVVDRAANAFFSMAANALFGYPMIAAANASLLMAHGTPRQKEAFAGAIYGGRAFGTMCLSEPQAGSSLSDIATRALPDGDGYKDDPLGPRYRLRGTKMWISAGEHELTDNIIHLVLAKAPDEDGKVQPGVRGISLFIVPRFMVDERGEKTGARNDVALVGLNHKLGNRGTVNTLLNFGEGRFPVPGGDGAVGYLVGKVGQGLVLMFHMMNEMRIEVGLGATMLGMAGYLASLEYARQRPQGRPVGPAGKDPSQPQARIVEHADVRRMLLAQKAYCEGALALELYCARLVDDQKTAGPEEAAQAGLLLEILTPIAKSWPSEWCLEANSLAIQIHGGYGYTRDFSVEQYWRDNRLNMIHEGTHGIQALDLLHRKVRMQEGRAMALLAARVRDTITRAWGVEGLRDHASALDGALAELLEATTSAWEDASPSQALANATPYMQGFGHVVLAWLWLDVALAACDIADDMLREGKLAAARYFFHYELPKIHAWLAVAARRDLTCHDLDERCL